MMSPDLGMCIAIVVGGLLLVMGLVFRQVRSCPVELLSGWSLGCATTCGTNALNRLPDGPDQAVGF